MPPRDTGVPVRVILLSALGLMLLGACTLPRGAALQSEILSQANDAYPDIAVYPVSRNFLPIVGTWPATGARPSHGWIKHGPSHDEILIQPFDRIDLTVWDSEDNSLITAPGQKLVDISELRVSSRGQIVVPYIGYLQGEGRTPDAARRLVEREMTAIVPSAQVQLKVTPGQRGSVSLVSGVAQPGSVPLPEGHFTVLNLISQGGGPQNLRNPQIRLIREGRTFVTSYKGLLEDPSRDTVLRGGDKVALVEDDRYFRALGASGQEQLIYFPDDSVSALDAMSMMGGINDQRANPKGVLILREYPAGAVRFDDEGPNNTRVVFTIDLTSSDGLFSAGRFPIYPGDTVLATESPITAAESVIGILLSTNRFANAIAN